MSNSTTEKLKDPHVFVTTPITEKYPIFEDTPEDGYILENPFSTQHTKERNPSRIVLPDDWFDVRVTTYFHEGRWDHIGAVFINSRILRFKYIEHESEIKSDILIFGNSNISLEFGDGDLIDVRQSSMFLNNPITSDVQLPEDVMQNVRDKVQKSLSFESSLLSMIAVLIMEFPHDDGDTHWQPYVRRSERKSND